MRFNKNIVLPLLLLSVPLMSIAVMKFLEPTDSKDNSLLHNPQYPDIVYEKNFPFINYELNRIDFPGGKFELPFRKQNVVDPLKSTSIVHFGGSHVQAGTMTSRLRNLLHEYYKVEFPDRGFFLPSKLASNGPDYVFVKSENTWEDVRSSVPSHEGHWSFSGFNLLTRDSEIDLCIKAVREDSSSYSFVSSQIFYEGIIDSILIENALEIVHLPNTNVVQAIFKGRQDSLKMRVVNSKQNDFNLKGIRLLSNGIAEYNAIGVNGASTESFLRCDFSDFHLLSPDLVIFGLGINDAYKTREEFDRDQFKQNYLQLMDSCRMANPRVKFLFLTNTDSYYKRNIPNVNAFVVRDVMYEIAEEEKCAVYDLFEVMGGLGSIKKWEESGLAKEDKIHFTREGYELQANMLFEALINEFGD